jgi:hypothetical protein
VGVQFDEWLRQGRPDVGSLPIDVLAVALALAQNLNRHPWLAAALDGSPSARDSSAVKWHPADRVNATAADPWNEPPAKP